MPQQSDHIKRIDRLPVFFAAVLLVSFFLPWVLWKDAVLSGNAMPTGQFFSTARDKFGLSNPFPQLGFAFNIFWLIPAAAIAVLALAWQKKNILLPALVAGALSLSLTLVYFLFSQKLVELGADKSAWSMVKPWLFVHAAGAVGLAFSASRRNWILKTSLLAATAVIAVVGFSIASKEAEKKIFEETFNSTNDIKADYLLSMNDLLKEFVINDTAANKKYTEKVLQVNGTVSAVNISSDSTGTIRFEDSAGSYAIFSMEKSQVDKMKNIKAGDAVSVKGVCSGSIFSDILGSTSINFKRSILNK